MTGAQKKALEWFAKHGGDGCFERNGVLLAGGESAPHTRSTWNALRNQGHVEFYHKNRRVRIAQERAA